MLDQDCGDFGTPKVFGGREIVLMSRPWMALLKFEELFGREAFTCGGTFIHKRKLTFENLRSSIKVE